MQRSFLSPCVVVRICFFVRGLTDELALTCAILRYQAIMSEVNEAHIEEYGQSIVDRIESETSGKYKRLLVKMVENSMEPCR